MQSTKPLAPSRRQFALSGLALGASALTAARGALAADAPAQSSGPIVLHGASPRLTVHTIDTFHGMAATGLRHWRHAAKVRARESAKLNET